MERCASGCSYFLTSTSEYLCVKRWINNNFLLISSPHSLYTQSALIPIFHVNFSAVRLVCRGRNPFRITPLKTHQGSAAIYLNHITIIAAFHLTYQEKSWRYTFWIIMSEKHTYTQWHAVASSSRTHARTHAQPHSLTHTYGPTNTYFNSQIRTNTYILQLTHKDKHRHSSTHT